MNIYFACSVTGGRQDEPAYQAIVNALLADGHKVPTAILASPEVVSLEAVVDPVDVYTRDVAWIKGCDVMVAEVSTPSHGVGYEIGYALSISKTVLCVYQAGIPVSKMILGNTDPKLKVAAYRSPEEAVDQVRAFLARL
jgi:hypothetical protein